MKAAEVKFQDLLNGKIQYRVPLFQRTYSWQEDNWQRLWDDILELYALETPRSHFIGAVVTQPIDDSPENCAKFMLIDGQQRLTTLFILLAEIRRAATSEDNTAALSEEIADDCLFNKHARVEDEQIKMRPTQHDLTDFNNVLTGNLILGIGPIIQAHRFFQKALLKGDLNGDPIQLANLKSCVTDYLNLVSIKLDPDDSAPRIFESLNNTGMALTASDLVRNHIFMNITSEADQNRAYHSLWLPMQIRMEEPSGGSVLTDFFWRFIMMDGRLPRYEEVFEGMRDYIDKARASARPMLDILEELDRYSQLYVRMWKPEHLEPIEAVRRQLSRLNQWEVDVSYPFVLASMHRWHLGEIDEAALIAVLRMIESYAVRRFVCDIPTNRLRRIFAGMAAKVGGGEFIQSARRYLADNDWPSDQLFHDRFRIARIYSPARLSRTRLILSSLEESYEHHEPIVMTDQITIEHVMPQTLSDEWRSVLGQQAAEVHEEYLHTIGNLTYSGYNSEMGNLPFAEKKNILRQSHFELNRGIISTDEWTREAIEARANEMADRALAVWSREA